MDLGDHGSAAHQVRLYWTNMLPIGASDKVFPNMLQPSPPLHEVLLPYHEPSVPGNTDQRPFATHNIRRGERICMPKVVSFLHNNAFRPNPDGSLGEGQVYNVIYKRWEEPEVGEKERLLGFRECDTATPGTTED